MEILLKKYGKKNNFVHEKSIADPWKFEDL